MSVLRVIYSLLQSYNPVCNMVLLMFVFGLMYLIINGGRK